MKMPPFKTLSTKIWSMLVVMSIIFILLISSIYIIVIRQIEKNYDEQVLAMGHEFILDRMSSDESYKDSLRFDQDIPNMEALMRVHTVIVQDEGTGYSMNLMDRKSQLLTKEVVEVATQMMAYTSDLTAEGKIYELDIRVPAEKEGTQKETIYATFNAIDEQSALYMISYIKAGSREIISEEAIMLVALFILSSFWIAKVIANSICKPLKQLETHAFKIANREWVEALDIRAADEIGSLVDSINYMQRELQKNEEEQKRFLQSISHDLKTPIMIISGHAQAIHDGMYIDSIEHTAEVIINESERLEKMVTKMLYFNTLDYTLERNSRVEEIDLAVFMNKMIQKFKLVNKELNWVSHLESVKIYINEEQLEVAIENILDNQLRYAKTKIVIELKESKGRAYLRISNDGELIDANKIGHVFDHLYKDKQGKFGLGLAITHKVIQFYGGRIAVSNQEEGVVFEITL